MQPPTGIDLTSAVSLRRLATSSTPGGEGLRGIDLDVLPGTFTVVAGGPGDGTDDVAQVLSGTLEPTSAERFRVFGVELMSVPAGQRAAWLERHVTLVDGPAPLLPYLTVAENLRLADRSGESAETVAALAGRGVLARVPALLTGHETWLVSLALALSSASDILVVRLPSDPRDTAWTGSLRRQVDLIGRTVILTGGAATCRLADAVIVLRAGRLAGDRPDAVPADHETLE